MAENALGIAIGFSAGRTHQGTSAVSIRFSAGTLTQGANSVAIGLKYGEFSQGRNSVAIGNVAGEVFQGPNSVAIGSRAGNFTQGTNSIVIGLNAGLILQTANSIALYSSGATFNGATSSSCYVAPIRNVVTNSLTNNFLCYDHTNKDVVQAPNIQLANTVSFPLGTAAQTSVNFGTLNTGIWLSSANSINVSVAGTQRLDLTGLRLQMALPIQYSAEAQNTPQIYFSTD